MVKNKQFVFSNYWFIQNSIVWQFVLRFRFLVGSLLLLSFLSSCASQKILTKKEKKQLHTQITDTSVFSKSHTGFALYDPIKKEMLYEYDSDKLFTPASNTKIFTLYAALKILGDSIPALAFVTQGDSLIFWGTGDPSLWHPDLPENTTVEQRLKDTTYQLFYYPHNFMDERYGSGWAWDDYPYSYQVEKSALPVFGNGIQIKKEQLADSLEVLPAYFISELDTTANDLRSSPRFKRDRYTNKLQFLGRFKKEKDFHQFVPFVYSDELLLTLLEAKLGRSVSLLDSLSITKEPQLLYSIPSDSLYQQMMQESDNFMAEQMLLLCANKIFDTLNTRKIIRYTQQELLADLPDPMRWVDGSGLSRYNLFSPRSIIRLLEKMYEEFPLERLFAIFPAGGASGTIKQYYTNEGQPFVYAKTGTLSNRHCLSGYLLTKQGKVLLFSFMHSNYYGSSKPLKEEMDKVLRNIYLEH